MARLVPPNVRSNERMPRRAAGRWLVGPTLLGAAISAMTTLGPLKALAALWRMTSRGVRVAVAAAGGISRHG